MSIDPADAVALRALVDRYAAAVDRRDADALTALFTRDALVRLPDVLAQQLPSATLTGPGQIATLLDAVREFHRTRHLVTQQVVDVTGDSASGELYCQAHHVYGPPERLRDLVLSLRYVDSFVRVGELWRFARRELVLDWAHRQHVQWTP